MSNQEHLRLRRAAEKLFGASIFREPPSKEESPVEYTVAEQSRGNWVTRTIDGRTFRALDLGQKGALTAPDMITSRDLTQKRSKH